MSRPRSSRPDLTGFLTQLYGWPRPYALRLSQCVALAVALAQAREGDSSIWPGLQLLAWSLSRLWPRLRPLVGPASHGKAFEARYDGPPLDSSTAARLASTYLAAAPTNDE